MTDLDKIEKRWEHGIPHHPFMEQLLRDAVRAGELDIKFGGDGDLGEDLLLALSYIIKRDSYTIASHRIK